MNKVTLVKEHGSGQKEGKFGTFTWYRLGIQFDGVDKWYNGFIKDYELKKLGIQYPSELKDKDFEIKTFQEEYNGQMQDKFEFIIPKGQKNNGITEMAIKTHISQEIAPIKEALRAIVDHLGIEAPKPTVGNTNVPYPEDEGYASPDDPNSVPF